MGGTMLHIIRQVIAWYWRPRRIMAAMVVGFWAHMAAFPDGYTSGTYTVIEQVLPLRVWAIAFVLAGAAMFATRPSTIAPAALVGVLLCVWAAGLFAAVWTGESQSPAGFVFVAGYIQLLAWGIGRDLPRA